MSRESFDITLERPPADQEVETLNTEEQFVHLALPVPLPGFFDYKIPKNTNLQQLQPGSRVLVPFGRRKICGIILSTSQKTQVPREKLRFIYEVLDDQPLLSPELLKIAQWASDYYFHPLGEVIFSFLPASFRKGKDTQQFCPITWTLTEMGNHIELTKLQKKSPVQAKALELLREHSNGLTTELLRTLGIAQKSLASLAKQG